MPDTIVTEATVNATIEMMGWQSQRIGKTSCIRLDEADGCGICGRTTYVYDVALGIPVCEAHSAAWKESSRG